MKIVIKKFNTKVIKYRPKTEQSKNKKKLKLFKNINTL